MILIAALLASGDILFAQTGIDTAAIRNRLEAIRLRDQKPRSGGDSVQFVHYIDSCNLVAVEALIAQYGWPTRSFVGPRGNNTVFLVIQHSDLPTQEKYLPLMEASVAQGESRPADLALLIDRVLMRQGKKQRYGSQVVPDDRGGQSFYPIEDEPNVNVRRASMGLQPIEEYAKFFGIDYRLPME